MKIRKYLNLLLFLFLSNILSSQELGKFKDIKALSFIPDYIFSGSTLDKWHSFDSSGIWKANNGIITGEVIQGNGPGILIFDESFQDIAFQMSIKRNSPVETGVLFRFERVRDLYEAVLVSIDKSGSLVPYSIIFDAKGNEKSRERLLRAGGISYRVAPPMKDNKEENNRFSGNKRPEPPQNLPVTKPNTDFVNGKWNQVESYVDVNMIRSFLNDGREVGGTTGEETNQDGYGPIALYIGGAGKVQFKNIFVKDASIKTTPLEKTSDRFVKQRISDMYYSWATDAADFNKDGITDIVAGPYIYYGPDFTNRTEIFPAITGSPSLEFRYNRIQDTYDFNNDGWPDVLASAFTTTLYINPKGMHKRWNSYDVLPGGGQTEITDFRDIDGDGKPELVYGAKGFVRYAKPNKKDPTKPWTVYNVSKAGHALAHGIGTGDINGDGRIDILNALGWWEQPEVLDTTKTWKYYPVAFGRYGKRSSNIGSSLMAVYDVNGNGLNDVVANLNSHGFGLAWYEQKRDEKGEISFVRHMIMDDYNFDNAGGVVFSQLHGATSGDIDNDGIKDYVVGKRYFSHLDNYADPDPYGAPVVYWYKTVRDASAPGGARFVPQLIDNRSGVGSEIDAVDLDNNGTLDILTSTNNGTYIYWNKTNPNAH